MLTLLIIIKNTPKNVLFYSIVWQNTFLYLPLQCQKLSFTSKIQNYGTEQEKPQRTSS